MPEHAYVKLVPESVQRTITLEGIKELLHYYQNITTKTGEQLDWEYGKKAFPYEIKTPPNTADQVIYLKSNSYRHHLILIGIANETVPSADGTEQLQSSIQVILPETSTYGDKGKANELCKFLAKKLQAQLHLFNKRVMYYYPRK